MRRWLMRRLVWLAIGTLERLLARYADLLLADRDLDDVKVALQVLRKAFPNA